jgi:hypothetical protein
MSVMEQTSAEAPAPPKFEPALKLDQQDKGHLDRNFKRPGFDG